MRSALARVFIVGSFCGLGLVGVYARNKPSAAAVVPRMFEVASVAYRSLENQLKSSETKIVSSDPEDQKWGFDMQHYNVEIMEYSDRVYVTFSLRPANGLRFHDGVFHFVLNETTGEILEQTRY
jgi:hypothetical protein